MEEDELWEEDEVLSEGQPVDLEGGDDDEELFDGFGEEGQYGDDD